MSFLKSDIAKVVGACLAAVCAVLVPLYPPPQLVGVICGVLVGILGALGLISGGTSGNQPANVATKPPSL